MKLQLRDTYRCSAEHFFDAMFFDPAYNEALYRQGLGFEQMQILEDVVADDGARTRRMRVKPKLDAPRAVRKLIGDALTYEEHGRYDPATRRWATRIVTSKLADRIQITTDVTTEARGDSECVRVADFVFSVRVLGAGRVFEQFIARTMRENYDKAARFSNEWLRNG